MSNDLKSGIYLHHSGLLVQVIGVAKHSETNEKLVAYVPLGVKAGPRITVRPYDMFFEDVEKDGESKPRFEYIGEEVSEELAKKYLPLSK
ncbi:MAG: DUF1653 domain-containing protein [Candidatus Saccharibacteria bacterium]|nr:DUF1653 domain-containing protein [Candidatus Saccharibacteria bacterium]